MVPGNSQERRHLEQDFPDVHAVHVAVEHYDSAVCEALPGKALQKSLLAPKAIEQQVEAFPVHRSE